MIKKPKISDERIKNILKQLSENKKWKEIKFGNTLEPSGTISKVLKWWITPKSPSEPECLSWEEAKAFCGNNDNILKLRVNYLKRIHLTGTQQRELEHHFDELAGIVHILLLNLEKWSRYGDTAEKVNIIDGGILDFRLFTLSEESELPMEKRNYQMEKVDGYLANECLLPHFNYQFDYTFKDLRELTPKTVTKDIRDNLEYLAHSKAFTFCPTCPVCQGIGNLLHKSSIKPNQG